MEPDDEILLESEDEISIEELFFAGDMIDDEFDLTEIYTDDDSEVYLEDYLDIDEFVFDNVDIMTELYSDIQELSQFETIELSNNNLANWDM